MIFVGQSVLKISCLLIALFGLGLLYFFQVILILLGRLFGLHDFLDAQVLLEFIFSAQLADEEMKLF